MTLAAPLVVEFSIFFFEAPGYGKFFLIFFFLKLDHFLRTFCKKCIVPLKIQKNLENFSKNDKTTFRPANFCLLRCQILALHAQ